MRGRLGRGLHAFPRKRDDLPKWVAPRAGDDFYGMEPLVAKLADQAHTFIFERLAELKAE